MEDKSTTPQTIIVPTVGRVVWYWPATAELDLSGDRQPCRADICHVNHDGTLNLVVSDHFGIVQARRGIQLHQGDADGCSLPRPFATWMPYQRGQAAKADSIDSAKPEAAELHRQMLAEQVRQLRLSNDSAQIDTEQKRLSIEEAKLNHERHVAWSEGMKKFGGMASQQLKWLWEEAAKKEAELIGGRGKTEPN